uniref:Myb-like domain-containing protein n=1 Tax=Brassica oleracea var. oleracea TaxID=109376 RepID=A0A0D3API2_BRAOL
MSLRGTWHKATGLPNGVGKSKVYGIDFILIVSLLSLFRRRFQTNGHLVVQSTPISPVIEPFSAESNRNRGLSFLVTQYSFCNLVIYEIPPFSSQQTDAPDVREDTPVACRERRKWTPADDEVLISAWLNTSKDVVVENEQKSGTFWKRVGEYYAASLHARESGEPREHLHCKQRWHKINDFTNKFCGAYAAAERQISFGQNDNDVLNVSHDIFYSDHNTKFNLEHACLNTPKISGSSKRKAGETCSQTSSTTIGDHEIRPEGIKAAKAKRNNAQGKSLAEYTSIWEMKKEDLMMKEKLLKLAILDTLLAKKKPLSLVKMGRRYSYSQPSDSEEYGGEIADIGYISTEELIRRDQAELSINYSTSYTKNDLGRRYYTCEQVDEGECHVWKWWDVAVMEEMRARDRHILQLAEKVDSLTFLSDFEIEQKLVRLEKLVCDLAKKRSSFINGFEVFVGVMIIVLVFIEPKRAKKRIFIERNREEGHQKLSNDYFSDTPTYTPKLFRRRFRMNKSLFLRIVHRLSTEVLYFQPTEDATGRSSLSPLQKCTAAIRQLAYGGGADTVDEYVRLAETTARKCLHNFTAGIISLFGDEYLRRPTPEDLERLLHIGEERGFPGMIGSIDCMHWEWKNCPTAWKEMYSRGTGKPTIMLEAVASYDLWIWHAFFGAPGTMNDLNILDRSPIFDDIFNGNAPQVNFYVNGTEGLPQGEKNSLFAKTQETVRKDVERAFGVLQARFAVVKNPSKLWDKDKIANIMRACIILHNMIVEEERSSFTQYDVFEF